MADHPSPAAARASPRDAGGRARSLWLIAGLGLVLLAVYVAPYVIRGYRFAVGADAPVYLWWARIAGRDGLSATGYRPGVPALILLLQGTLGLSPAQAVAATGAALASALGLAAAALAMAGGHGAATGAGTPEARPAEPAIPVWAVAGLFAGLFAATLANGYLASLAAGVLCLAAMASLVAGRPEGTVLAAALLGAAGVTHVAFLLLAILVLLAAVAMGAMGSAGGLRAVAAPGSEGRRVMSAVIGGATVAGAGLLATIGLGVQPIAHPDTSKDAFLRRVGRSGELHDLYRSRFWSNSVRLLPPVLPAAIGALTERAPPAGETALGLRRRILLAWLAVTAAGIVFSLATGLLPGARFLAFCFAIPILAATGVARLWRGALRLPAAARPGARPRWGRPAAVLVAAAVAALSILTWWHPAESIRPQDMAAATAAAAVVQQQPPGTPIVFVVDDPKHTALGIPRFGSEIRAALPPDRIRDVHLFVGRPADYVAGRPSLNGNPLHNALSVQYLDDLRSALRDAARPPVALMLRPMNERGFHRPGTELAFLAPGVAALGLHNPFHHPGPLPPAPDPVLPTAPWVIALSSLAALALLWVAGFGWAAAALGPGRRATTTAGAAAPATGIAALVLAGTLVDRFGVRLTGAVPVILSAAVAGGGYLARRRFGAGRERGVLQG